MITVICIPLGSVQLHLLLRNGHTPTFHIPVSPELLTNIVILCPMSQGPQRGASSSNVELLVYIALVLVEGISAQLPSFWEGALPCPPFWTLSSQPSFLPSLSTYLPSLLVFRNKPIKHCLLLYFLGGHQKNVTTCIPQYMVTFLKIYTYQALPPIAFFMFPKKKKKKVTTCPQLNIYIIFLNIKIAFEAILKIGNHVSHSIGIDLENIPIEHYLGLMLEIYPLSTILDCRCWKYTH